jgi:hypothetical protein
MECGAADRIPQDTLLERSKTVWDSTLGSWDVFTRCVHPGDCVPFLVRVPGGEFPPEIAPSARQVNSPIAERAIAPSSAARATLPVGKPLVLPGEAVTLLWEHKGLQTTQQELMGMQYLGEESLSRYSARASTVVHFGNPFRNGRPIRHSQSDRGA